MSYKTRLKDLLLAKKIIIIFLLIFLALTAASFAENPQSFGGFALPKVKFDFEKANDPFAMSLQLIMYLSIISLSPFVIICTTSFIRITVIFSFLKTSLGTTHTPSNQIWIGLTIVLTLYIMAPVGKKMEKEAIIPFKNNQIQYNQFVNRMQAPLIQFMKANTRKKDLQLFVMLSKQKNQHELMQSPPLHLMIPAFIISEMKTAFFVGFLIYLPFLCVDMITAAVLMSMGMFMMSPMGISLPLKLLMFCMINGWELLIEGLIKSFRQP